MVSAGFQPIDVTPHGMSTKAPVCFLQVECDPVLHRWFFVKNHPEAVVKFVVFCDREGEGE